MEPFLLLSWMINVHSIVSLFDWLCCWLHWCPRMTDLVKETKRRALGRRVAWFRRLMFADNAGGKWCFSGSLLCPAKACSIDGSHTAWREEYKHTVQFAVRLQLIESCLPSQCVALQDTQFQNCDTVLVQVSQLGVPVIGQNLFGQNLYFILQITLRPKTKGTAKKHPITVNLTFWFTYKAICSIDMLFFIKYFQMIVIVCGCVESC